MNRNRELISARTRDAFRDAAVSYFNLTDINWFDQLKDSGLEPQGLPGDRAPTIGMLVEGFYAAVDWSDYSSIRPIIPIFEALYRSAPDSVWGHREELAECLFQDGLQISGGRLSKLPI